MRARLLIAFALGAVLGGAAVLLVTGPRSLDLPRAAAGPETVRILVAKRELVFGTKLTPKDLQWVPWSKAAVPPDSFTSIEALFGEKGDQTRVVLHSIDRGEPVLEGKITKLGEAPPLTMNLGDGQRAVSVEVDTTLGVAGFVALGDRVDIMLVREIEEKRVSSIILQDVLVLAVDGGRGGTADEPGFRMITVEVGVVEAQKLALAQQVGRLTLTWRGIGGEPSARSPEITPRRLPRQPGLCERPWSGYRDIREDILIPDLCRSSFRGLIGPGRDFGRPVRMRGDFGVPRGLDAPRHPAEPEAPSAGACAPKAPAGGSASPACRG